MHQLLFFTWVRWCICHTFNPSTHSPFDIETSEKSNLNSIRSFHLHQCQYDDDNYNDNDGNKHLSNSHLQLLVIIKTWALPWFTVHCSVSVSLFTIFKQTEDSSYFEQTHKSKWNWTTPRKFNGQIVWNGSREECLKSVWVCIIWYHIVTIRDELILSN